MPYLPLEGLSLEVALTTFIHFKSSNPSGPEVDRMSSYLGEGDHPNVGLEVTWGHVQGWPSILGPMQRVNALKFAGLEQVLSKTCLFYINSILL